MTRASGDDFGVCLTDSRGRWGAHFATYTIAAVVVALVPLCVWLALSHATECQSDASRRDKFGFIFFYEGGYSFCSAFVAVLMLTCQCPGLTGRTRRALFFIAPVLFYASSAATNVALASSGILESPSARWVIKSEVVLWVSALHVVALISLLCSHPSGTHSILWIVADWVKVTAIVCFFLAVYYTCQVYVHVFISFPEWASDFPDIVVSVCQIVLVVLFYKLALASLQVLVQLVPFPQYPDQVNRERWNIVMAAIFDGFALFFGRSVFFALKSPYQLAIVIFMDYFYDFYHFFLHTIPWFVLREAELTKTSWVFDILFRINRVVILFWPSRLRVTAGVQIDVTRHTFRSKLLRPQWSAASWRNELKNALTLEPVQNPAWGATPAGAVDVRSKFCDRALFVRVHPDPDGEPLTEEDVHEALVTAVSLQVALRFHVRIACKLSATLLFIASRSLLATTGGFHFHARMEGEITGKDVITLGVFLGMDLIELVVGLWTILKKPKVCDFAGQWLFSMYGVSKTSRTSAEPPAASPVAEIPSVDEAPVSPVCIGSVGVSDEDICRRLEASSYRRMFGAGFWLLAACLVHIAQDTVVSAFQFDRWCLDSLW